MTWAAFERNAYQAARSWGMQPSEFWVLPVCDWWVELDGKIAENKRIEDLTKGGSARSGFSQAEWADARARHKAKMNDGTRSP